jgi:integrase
MGDINGNVIHLQRSINKLNEETSGKNENAQRTLVLNDLSKGILANQKQALFDNGILSDFVFPYNDGEHAQLNIFYKRWVRYRDSNGIKNKASPYELRHTFVSVAKALPEGVLKSIVGHSQGMDTYGVYSHEVDGELSAIAEQLQEAFMRYL